MSSQPQNVPFNNKLYDQFKLAEQLGYINSATAMAILRRLLSKDNRNEGELAASVGCRLFRPDWKPLIEKLREMGYVSIKGTGHGMARIVSITDVAKEFLADARIEVEPEQVVEQPTEQQG
jgi:hypothetical protein